MTVTEQTIKWKNSAARVPLLVWYTLLWGIAAGLMTGIFAALGHTFLWFADGLFQHFPAFNCVCDIAERLLHGQFDWSGIGPYSYTLGQGADLLTTLNCYDFTDPVSWVCGALLFLTRLQRYTLMIFVKLWLIGAAFCFCCKALEYKEKFAVLCGALAYTFSSAVLVYATCHPNYINWAYFLPFLIGGYVIFKHNQKWLPLLLAVFFNLLTNYYTFFMNAVLLVIYVCVDYAADLWIDRSVKCARDGFFTALRAAGVSALGCLLTGFVMVPTAYAFLQNPRVASVSGYTASLLHYTKSFYIDLLQQAFVPFSNIGELFTFLGFTPLLPAVLIAFYLRRGGSLRLKILLPLLGVLCGVPLFGRLMNGMGYAVNRWCYAIVFFTSLALAEILPQLKELSVRGRIAAAIVTLCYIGFCALPLGENTLAEKLPTIAALLAGVCVFGAACALPRRASAALLCCAAVCGACFEVYGTFAPSQRNYIRQFAESDHVESTWYHDPAEAVSGLSGADDFYRVERNSTTGLYYLNLSGMHGVHGTNVWWSVLPSYLLNTYSGLELNDVRQNCMFQGLDGRTALLELAGVKYFCAEEGSNSAVPYGYEKNEALSTEQYTVYENPEALPVAYTYDAYLTEAEYDELDSLGKQEALLQAAVVEEPVEGMTAAEPGSGAYALSYELAGIRGGELTADTLTAGTDGGGIVLRADVPENCEIYLRVAGAGAVSPEWLPVTAARKNADGSSEVSKSIYISNGSYKWPVERTAALFNLGSDGAGENEFYLNLTENCTMHFDNIEIIAVPMEHYTEQVQKLGEYTLQNAVVTGSKVTGSIEVPDTRLLQFSIPYSTGWTAYVDGEKTELLQTDGMYMSVLLQAGSHDVELRYETPYWKTGAAVSLLSLAAVAALAAVTKRRTSVKAAQTENGEDDER